MRKLFTATGELSDEASKPKQADEKIVELATELRYKRPELTFSQAKHEVLRQNPELAQQYKEQF